MPALVRVLRPGDPSTPTPYTVCIAANPWLEAPWQSGQFAQDPITADPPAFEACVQYIHDALFGRLANQREAVLADPDIESAVRVVSIFEPGLPPADAHALAAQDGMSTMLIARRRPCAAYAARHGFLADVVYAVSASPTHRRASAFYTTDDDARPGVPFTLDGATLHHRFYPAIPGTVAIHAGASTLTALHEFQHAASSYSNGGIADLYVDDVTALGGAPGTRPVNLKAARPIPSHFATYQGAPHASDGQRDGLGYPPEWRSYHCALHDPGRPAIMDDFRRSDNANQSQNDTITRQFLRDRILAKIARPPAGAIV